jgi:hypothetical protein
MYVQVTFRHVRVTIVAVEKKRITYSECVSVVLVIQHVKRIRLSDSTIFFHIIS